MAIGLIWIGYGIAVAGIAFGTHDAGAAAAVGTIGAIVAAVATAFAASSKD